ncbi:MAG: DUF2314 domain-containing protein [Chthonomonas sp.]|nr:DUF2314 domain-containing protein [Chthonomonas sp.]
MDAMSILKVAIPAFGIIGALLYFSQRNRVPETFGGTVSGETMQREMDAAIAHARVTVDDFIAALTSEFGTDFSVKKMFEDAESDRSEHAWLTDLTYKDGVFTGKLGNDMAFLKKYKLGETYSVHRDDISDWMFIRDDKMHGNFTMRPLFYNMSPQEVTEWKQQLADPELTFAQPETQPEPESVPAEQSGA